MCVRFVIYVCVVCKNKSRINWVRENLSVISFTLTNKYALLMEHISGYTVCTLVSCFDMCVRVCVCVGFSSKSIIFLFTHVKVVNALVLINMLTIVISLSFYVKPYWISRIYTLPLKFIIFSYNGKWKCDNGHLMELPSKPLSTNGFLVYL